jgi:hypothetical protein
VEELTHASDVRVVEVAEQKHIETGNTR